MEKKILIYIGSMTCVNCQNKIEHELNRTSGVIHAHVSYNSSTAEILYDPEQISIQDIEAVIKSLDYEVLHSPQAQSADLIRIVCMLTIIIALYVMLQATGILNLLVPGRLADSGMSYGMLFIIGLTTSVHCIAMCGGINLSQCIPQAGTVSENSHRAHPFRSAVLYNLGRLGSYTAIGFFLGLISFLIGGRTGTGISIFFQGILKMSAGIFMVIMGLNMLDLFPVLRTFTIRLPRSAAHRINAEKVRSKQPFYVGILNGFMPCGPMQSMWIVAFAAGNPFSGAISMFLFCLGTIPLMLGFGSVISALGKKFTDQVTTAGAVLITVLGLAMLSQGVSLAGWPSPVSGSRGTSISSTVELTDGVQIVRSTLESGKYPDITVQKGIPVKWIIDAPQGSINGCNYKILIRDLNLEHTFSSGENIIEFTPKEPGTIQYSCWMGMIHGSILITDN